MKETPFSRVLIANRGEVALRIMRSVRAAGMEAVGVVTDEENNAPHAQFADRLVNIGRGPVGDSYLSIDKMLAAARESGAEAVHPGYGFLAENPDFARACAAAGLVFIGPSAAAMEVMGNKASARRAAGQAGVACVPGFDNTACADDVLTRAAAKIGFPVMIKASAGGGGRGMRLVGRAGDFNTALDMARSESQVAFGSNEVILEKAVVNARHIEVQVFADRSGHTIHLGERDCSVQRRHQKIIEESPAPGLSNTLRAQMGAAAVKIAQAVAYEGAGTVEFLLDENGTFYFLEMNTRLQVEHGVTEAVTGLDLVAMQLAVACGRLLDLRQQDVSVSGHAIEARLYAEDPANGFLPASGRLVAWDIGSTPGLRVESGVATGDVVSPYCDPMLAKLIVQAPSRDQARLGLISALEQSRLFGPVTNRDFLIDVLAHVGFAAGEVTTSFLARKMAGMTSLEKQADPRLIAAAAVLLWQHDAEAMRKRSCGTPRALIGWSSQGGLVSKMALSVGGARHDLTLTAARDGVFEVRASGVNARVAISAGRVKVDDWSVPIVGHHSEENGIFLATRRRTLWFERVRAGAGNRTDGGDGRVTAPMHGVLREVFVEAGQQVERGQRLAVLEAMKMQHELVAGPAGVVVRVPLKAGAQVRPGALIVEIKPN